MEKMIPYFLLGVLILAVIITVLLVLSILGQGKLFKSIATNKFGMHDIEEVAVDSGKKTFALIVANKSMNDAAITSVGVVSGLDYFDFNKSYKLQNNLTDDSAIVMQPRTPIKLTLDIAEVESLVFKNLPNGKFQKIKVYVIDSAGNLYVHKAKNFDKILRKSFKECGGAVPDRETPVTVVATEAEIEDKTE